MPRDGNRVPVKAAAAAVASRTTKLPPELGQVVLVLQGGGALGAYQLGVYRALHESGIQPDWVIGTSIGAINAAIIVGNPLEKRLEQLSGFRDRIMRQTWLDTAAIWPNLNRS